MADPRFAKTMFLVRANSYERLCLWRENHSLSTMCIFGDCSHDDDKGPRRKVKWVQDSMGLFQRIGEFGGMPICVNLVWVTIDGCLVCFYEATSMVAHHQMIEDWLTTQCDPKWDQGTRQARCDAMNFHHCLNAIEQAKK